MEKDDKKSARRRLLKGHLGAGIVGIARRQLGCGKWHLCHTDLNLSRAKVSGSPGNDEWAYAGRGEDSNDPLGPSEGRRSRP